MDWEEHFLTLEEYRKLMVNEIKHANLLGNDSKNNIDMSAIGDSLENDVVTTKK